MDVLKAVLSINPQAELDVYEENIKTINWRGGTAPISEAEIQTEMTRLQAEFDAQAYARNRAAEYPSQGDQNDMMYKDTKNSTTTHADAVEVVKTKWPKDNSGPVE
jgi:hypothetical protein